MNKKIPKFKHFYHIFILDQKRCTTFVCNANVGFMIGKTKVHKSIDTHGEAPCRQNGSFSNNGVVVGGELLHEICSQGAWKKPIKETQEELLLPINLPTMAGPIDHSFIAQVVYVFDAQHSFSTHMFSRRRFAFGVGILVKLGC